MKILLVDDEEDIVAELGSFLRRRGHAIVGAGDVQAALHALDSDGPFDVVLTDLRMPGGSGLDVVRACRDRPEPRPISLMMSGHAGCAEIAQARADGALRFFPKPVALHALLGTLADIELPRLRSQDAPLLPQASAP